MRIENNNEQDPSLFRENQPCTLAAMTTDIKSSYTFLTWSMAGPMLNIWELNGGANQYETCGFNLDLNCSRTYFMIRI
jgi:hypothetical protein